MKVVAVGLVMVAGLLEALDEEVAVVVAGAAPLVVEINVGGEVPEAVDAVIGLVLADDDDEAVVMAMVVVVGMSQKMSLSSAVSVPLVQLQELSDSDADEHSRGFPDMSLICKKRRWPVSNSTRAAVG